MLFVLSSLCPANLGFSCPNLFPPTRFLHAPPDWTRNNARNKQRTMTINRQVINLCVNIWQNSLQGLRSRLFRYFPRSEQQPDNFIRMYEVENENEASDTGCSCMVFSCEGTCLRPRKMSGILSLKASTTSTKWITRENCNLLWFADGWLLWKKLKTWKAAKA